MTVNPLGTVPGQVDGDVVMTESAAICQYLVERYGPTDLGLNVRHLHCVRSWLAKSLDIDEESTPNVQKYWDRVSARLAFQRAYEKQRRSLYGDP